jgi:hypothetical protein
MREFRGHLLESAGLSVPDAVPVRIGGRPVQQTPVVSVVSVQEATTDGHDLDGPYEGEHPSTCGCWQCDGYPSYEAWAATTSTTSD